MKIAIIGAGINGLYLARKIAERGDEVSVFERKKTIGKQACSGLFSERILEFIPESKSLIQNQIRTALIHFPRKTIKLEFKKNFVVMNHFELDNLVAKLAEKSGTKIILNSDVSEDDCNKFSNEFDRVIGCDGPNSVVRKSLKLPNPNYRLAIQGFLSKEDNSDCVETWPIKKGFIWKIPRGREVEYGIIGDPKTIKGQFDGFLDKNNLQLEKLESALVPQSFLIPAHHKITLCGDAAGLTKPWSGGGVIWGLMAAEILLKNFPDFLRYKKEMKKFFLHKIILSKMATIIVYFIGFKMPWILPQKIKVEGDFLL